MSLPTGARLGAFEVIADLGAGGMGEVYRARDTRLERTVAIKVLSPALAADPVHADTIDRRGQLAVGFDESLMSRIRIMPAHEF
jgi:serine/threonine protein kinase